MGKSADDFDEFLALEQIAEKRKELESMCRLYAKPGTWDKFITYESKMRVQRKQEAEARQRQIAATIRYVSWGLITALSIGGFALLYFLDSLFFELVDLGFIFSNNIAYFSFRKLVGIFSFIYIGC